MEEAPQARALIVDDEYYLGQILAQALVHEGIQAVAVTEVDSAIEQLQKNEFDIVVSDIYLLGKTGVDLFHYALKAHPNLPFIFMTGNPDLEMAVEFLKKGGYDYIVKPFMIPDFTRKVKEVIRRSHKRIKEKSLVDDLKQILQHRLKELRIYQDVFESTDEGFMVLDLDGTIVKTNRGIQRLLGLKEKQLVNQSIQKILPTSFREISPEEVESIMKKGEVLNKETSGINSQAQEFISSFSLFPIKNENNQTFAYAAVIKDVTNQRRVEKALIQSLQQTTLAQEAIIFGLARLAEYRDQDTGYHLERIRSYCKILATALQEHPHYRSIVDAKFIDLLHRTAPLHDIGKVGIPDYILLKSGKLSPEEFKIMQTHTVIGYHTLKSIRDQYGEMDFLDMGIEITYCHHERYDGKGYPRGLKGDEIPLSAQILAIADVYDALTTQRVYKEAYSHEQSLEIMSRERGHHFDPQLFDVFITIADDFDCVRKAFQETTDVRPLII